MLPLRCPASTSDEFQLFMNQIPAIVERALDGTYSVHCKNEIFSGMGATVEDAKADMLKQMRFYVDTAKDAGFKYH